MTATWPALVELETALAAATPGPWFAWDRGVGWHLATEDPGPVEHLPGRPRLLPEGTRTDLGRAADAAAIVAAVNLAPALVAAVRASADALRHIAGAAPHCEASTTELHACRQPTSGRARDAKYGADRWCDTCVAADALAALAAALGDPQPDTRQCPATRDDGYRCQAFTAHDKHVDSLGRLW